jgi:uncharacterized membrane protein YbaN (DUF454 family)
MTSYPGIELMWHVFRTGAGIGLLIVGVIGLILPIIPGIPILIAGVAVLGTDHAIVQRGRKWLHSEHPLMRRVRGWLERAGILKRHQD